MIIKYYIVLYVGILQLKTIVTKIIAKRGQLFGEDYLSNKEENNLPKKIYADGECRVIKLLVRDALQVMNITKNLQKYYLFLST